MNIDFEPLEALPSPFGRYLKNVLSQTKRMIRSVHIEQRGSIRMGPDKKWMPFNATHTASVPDTSFNWNAHIKVAPLIKIEVSDCHFNQRGQSKIKFLSLPVISSKNSPEMDSGSLHRYLAEAVWYPTALLPQSGIKWTPINDVKSLATLTDGKTSVSLEFTFNDLNEVVKIYTPGRWGIFGKEFKQIPWEAHLYN